MYWSISIFSCTKYDFNNSSQRMSIVSMNQMTMHHEDPNGKQFLSLMNFKHGKNTILNMKFKYDFWFENKVGNKLFVNMVTKRFKSSIVT